MTQSVQMIGREGTEMKDPLITKAEQTCLTATLFKQYCKLCGPFRFNTALQHNVHKIQKPSCKVSKKYD